MSDDSTDEIEELRDRIELLEQRYEDLEHRHEALIAKHEALKKVVLGDLETYFDDVQAARSLWNQLADVQTATRNHGTRIDRLDSAGARGQPGAARVAKIRHALVRRATNRGTMTTSQAAQSKSPTFDYEDVLALFDYSISDAYASDLLDKAADGSSGFWTKAPSNPRDGRKTLRVDITELDSDSPYLRSAYQDANTEGRANEDFARTATNEHSEGGGSE